MSPMSANPLPKRLLSLVLTLCMVLSLASMSALATGDPSNDSNTADNAIVNGSFEEPGQTDKAPQLDYVPGWSTTATDRLIEFGVNTQANSAPQLWGTDKSIPDGKQFAELNADETSTLYQNVSTVGGHIYEWGLSHRGRMGKDTMALIIGPKQANAPAKPGKDGQDQFMRLTAWVQRNAQTLGVTVPRDGCSQRITVYSKKFDKNGGFLNNPGSESPFSTAPSNLYTETWSVWIIATGNQSWGSYGTHDPTYDPLKGIGGGIGCSYTVPVGQNETTFAFCSYAGATSDKTLGNLLDNITFSLYHNVTFTTTAGGQGTVSAEIQGTTQTVDFSDKNAIDVPVRHNREMTLTAPATADSGATFVGAYITRHSTSGSSTEFVDKSNESKWKLNGTTYTYTGTVTAPTDVVLVFVRSPAVTYDANGGDKYVHTPTAQEPTDVVSFAAGTGPYTSHAATASQTGWVFAGWLLARAGNGLVLPAVHTVSYANGTFTFTDETGQKRAEIEADGVALLAQWKWQQTFQTQLQQGDTVTDTDACGTITKDDSDASVKTYNAATGEKVTVTANAKPDYAFLGWYRTIDGQLQLVSQEQTYAYTVGKQGVQTVYARFAKTYTITYAWDESNSPKDPTVPTLPNPGTATAGTTYPLSQNFVPQKTTVSATVDGVPGHWLFQGVTHYQGNEIINNATITLYAQWEKLLDITIDYTPFPEDLGKVTLNSPQEEEPSEEDLVPHSIYTVSEKGSPDHQVHTFQGATAQPKDGCTFKGWYDQQENQCSKDLSFVPKAGTDNLYQSGSYVAVFEAQQYTLHFDANGGEGTMGDLTYTHGQDQSLTKCGFTRAGYDFLGWATAADGNVAYHDQQSLSITQDTTLYAVWKQQPNQGGSGGGHHNSGGTQENPDETPPTTLNDTDHYAYIVGYEDGTIRPNGHITRAEAATVFFRLLTDKARDANLTDRSPYPDVSAGDWYNKAVATLSRMGILSGYEDGSFRPNATVTRAEFAAMAARFDTEAKPVDTPFTDLTGCWAADEIAKAYGKGWVNGYGDNTFRPNGPITRAEAVTLINRVLRRLPETDKDLLPDERTWPDNPETFWGYLALQEASNSHLYDRKSDGYETQTKILPPRDWSQEFEQ